MKCCSEETSVQGLAQAKLSQICFVICVPSFVFLVLLSFTWQVGEEECLLLNK